jgi:hypothetical protein
MRHYAGLDVSVKKTSVCIIDESGKVCRETKVPSHPEDLARALHDRAWCLERVGIEAGLLSQWLSLRRAEFHGRTIRGLTVEQHLARLREGLLPLAERCGRAMRDALAALETLDGAPSRAVERSSGLRVALKL